MTHSTSLTPPDESHALRLKFHRQDFHSLEISLIIAVSTELAFLPWALGGMRVWSHWIALGLSVAAFVLSLWPRDYDDRSEGQTPFRLCTWPKLLRFPIFWLGLAFLGYVTLQALNPAWVYESDGKVFWMRQIPATTWLPVGMRAGFNLWNPWRMLVIYSAAWLTVCALWIGFTRRRAWQILFNAIVVNGFILAVVVALQELKGNGKLLWYFDPPTSYFVATIPYKNHAATYFNLVLALTVALGVWHFIRGLRRFDRSSPAVLFGFIAAIILMAVVFSYSRAGALLAGVFVLVTLGAVIVYQMRFATDKRMHLVSLALLVLFGVFAAVGSQAIGFHRVIARFDRLFKQDRVISIERRQVVRQATFEMARDRLLFGWGAGCFRFGFPIYQHRHELLIYSSSTKQNRVFWEHAHNDYVQALAEFGVAGCSVLLALAGSAAWLLARARFWKNPLSLLIAIGLSLVLVHAWIDFPFQNPAIITTWAVLLVGLIRWAELDTEWA